MAVTLRFDDCHQLIDPAAVVLTRSGIFLGTININGWKFYDSMKEQNWISFEVDKNNCGSIKWDDITDFKLLWIKDWNRLFEIHVDINESNSVTKAVQAVSLGEAELSQINLYNVEINTEDDISRDDYSPSVLYNQEDKKHSILNRILEKAPHYVIGSVDSSIAGIQRSFSFNETNIFDATNKIAEEIQCIFEFECSLNDDNEIIRTINVYDLLNVCLECGERGEFDDVCDSCGSDNIVYGYGKDTNIFVSSDALSEKVTYTTDIDKVKNCFRLEAGDDLMTATIRNCNPNGTGTIWYISEAQKKDMSDELVQKLNEYDEKYSYYLDTSNDGYVLQIHETIINNYNSIVQKYDPNYNQYKTIPNEIKGYAGLIEAYYNTIDFASYLNYTMMPNKEYSEKTAAQQAQNIISGFPDKIAVRNIESVSQATVESSVTTMAKALIDPNFKVSVSTTTFVDNKWTGTISITSYKNSEDTYIVQISNKQITDEYADYIKQAITKIVSKNTNDDSYDIIKLFDLEESQFKIGLGRYSLSLLNSIKDACQACINVMIENGVANNDEESSTFDIYQNLYSPYYDKLSLIDAEIETRNRELYYVLGKYDADGTLLEPGLQSELSRERTFISKSLNFEEYLGEKLWIEFSSYRREDTYKNQNYISDGLTNSEIFTKARQFLDVAMQDIIKSATLQHSISASLKNLLAIKEFEKLTDKFSTGNWIRIKIDETVYRLRLVSYQIDSSSIDGISVVFSDVVSIGNKTSDIESILDNANSMATSYDFVARQAKKGSDAESVINNWFENSMTLTNMKIASGGDNQNIEWDKHGLSCKEFIPELGEYDSRQLKIINRGLYLTDNNWETARTAVGNFIYYNPSNKKYEETYGVIADTLIGNLILSKDVGIYTEENSITLNKGGLVITADKRENTDATTQFEINKIITGDNGSDVVERLLYIDSDGTLVLNGAAKITTLSGDGDSSTIQDMIDTKAIELDEAINRVASLIIDEDGIKAIVSADVGEVYGKINTLSTSISHNASSIDAIVNRDGEMRMHFRYDDNGQYIIGKESDMYYLHLSNKALYIMKKDSGNGIQPLDDEQEEYISGVPLTTIDDSGLFADQATITTLHVGENGAYTWTYNSDGHLTLT